MNLRYISYAFMFLLLFSSFSFALSNFNYTITEDDIVYRIHVFETNGSITFPVTTYAEVLVIGEGGGGANKWYSAPACSEANTGGGAGGYRYFSNLTIPANSYNITVTKNAKNYTSPSCENGLALNGGNTTFWNITAAGGGAGLGGKIDSVYGASQPGGSGGGGLYSLEPAIGAPGNVPATTPPQGWNGGVSSVSYFAGGGGGACGNATGDYTGGIGCVNDINGSNVTYATGGSGLNTPTNYGDGNGGAGVVIIRYEIQIPRVSSNILTSINTTTFNTTTDLIGWANISDPDSGVFSVFYTWFMNGSNFSSGSVSGLSSNSTGIQHNIANISSTLLSIGQNWTLQLYATNGTIDNVTANTTPFCDNFGDGGICDHGYSGNWIQIATMENTETWTNTANDTSFIKEGAANKNITTGGGGYVTAQFNGSTLDLNNYTNLTMWLKTTMSVNSTNSVISLYLGNDTSNYYTCNLRSLGSISGSGSFYINFQKSSCTVGAGSPSWGNIVVRSIAITTASVAANWSIDDLRAVGSYGQFNDTANNLTRWTPASGVWEIQNVSGNKVLKQTVANGTASTYTNYLQHTFSRNATIYWTVNLGTSADYHSGGWVNTTTSNKYEVTAFRYNSGTSLYCNIGGAALNVTRVGGYGETVDIKTDYSQPTLKAYWKNSTMGDYILLCQVNTTITSQMGVFRLSATYNAQPITGYFDNILIQPHTFNATNTSTVNSSTIIIENTLPVITVLNFTENGYSYQLGPVELNFSAYDLDTSNLTYYVNWFRNGTNITSLAQTGYMTVNSTVSITPNVSVFNVSDNWYARVWVSDGTNISEYNITHNTTIQNYFSSISAYSPNAAGGVYTKGYLNFTLSGAQNATAYAVLGSSNVSMQNYGNGTSFIFNTSSLVPSRSVSLYSTNVTFYYTALLSNGSEFELTTNYSVQVSPSGFALCNATFNTLTANYTFYDSATQDQLNGSLSSQWIWTSDSGEIITNNIVNYSTLTQVCISPSWFNRSASVSDSASVSGYIPFGTTRMAYNYSSSAVAFNVSFVNSSTGAVYTFRTINQFGGSISGASIEVYKSGSFISSGTTDTAGNYLVALEQLQIYQIVVSATDYIDTAFVFIAGGTTSTDITLLPSNQENVTIPNFENVFEYIQYSVNPQNRFFKNATNISFTVFSNNSSLESWGMYIIFNGSSIYNVSQYNPSGGTALYLASQPGVYYMNIWFKANGYQNFTPTSYAFVFGNNTGIVAAGKELENESFIDGFTFYLIIIFLSLMATLWVSNYNPETAAPVGLLVLWGGTLMMPYAILVDFGGGAGITLWMASALSTVVAGSAWYIRQPGA